MLEHAIAELEQALTIVENNAPINESEGNEKQAAFERECAKSYRAALAILKKEFERQTALNKQDQCPSCGVPRSCLHYVEA